MLLLPRNFQSNSKPNIRGYIGGGYVDWNSMHIQRSWPATQIIQEQILTGFVMKISVLVFIQKVMELEML